MKRRTNIGKGCKYYFDNTNDDAFVFIFISNNWRKKLCISKNRNEHSACWSSTETWIHRMRIRCILTVGPVLQRSEMQPRAVRLWSVCVGNRTSWNWYYSTSTIFWILSPLLVCFWIIRALEWCCRLWLYDLFPEKLISFKTVLRFSRFLRRLS